MFVCNDCQTVVGHKATDRGCRCGSPSGVSLHDSYSPRDRKAVVQYSEEELHRSSERGFRLLFIAVVACFSLGFFLGFVAGRS